MSDDSAAPEPRVERLDASGLACPLPVLRANKTLRNLAVGDLLEVVVTDPSAPKDFEAFCAATGHHLVSIKQSGASFMIFIRKER